jgi:formylglycine-generating enzyme required for sulfatase activity
MTVAHGQECSPDLNGDGLVDGADLAVMLSNWGSTYPATIASVTPAQGSSEGGTVIAITGSGLGATSAVAVRGVPCSNVTVVSATEVRATTPPGKPGVASVSVTTPAGTTTADDAFSYVVIATPSWATLIEAEPDPAIVTSAQLRGAIIASGHAWRVRDSATNIEMVLVPPGTFDMGCTASSQHACANDEIPVHQVTLTNAYYIGRHEVTQAQWTEQMGSNPSFHQSASAEVPALEVPNRPVELVAWDTVQGFLSATDMRLPTEAEWEYAYRAGTTTAFHGRPTVTGGTSDDAEVGAIAWFGPNAGGQTRPVGGKDPNGLGLHDMSGNAWEWVNDWHSDTYYASSPATDPQGPATGTKRVVRGGWFGGASAFLRGSFRGNPEPGTASSSIGFRVARNP